MSSCNSTHSKEEAQEGRIVKPMSHIMVGYDATSNKDQVRRSASAMTVDLRKFGTVSGKRYVKPFGELVCVWGFEKALLTGN